jgi:HK97 family phage major capsid protein
MFSGSGPDGGWSVSPILGEGIGSIVRNASALRSLVNFIEIGADDSFEELVSTIPVGAAWVGEKQARPETISPKLAKIVTMLNEMYACPVLTQKLAGDSGTAMVDFLINETALSMAESEEDALFNGDGINKPRGLATIVNSNGRRDATGRDDSTYPYRRFW